MIELDLIEGETVLVPGSHIKSAVPSGEKGVSAVVVPNPQDASKSLTLLVTNPLNELLQFIAAEVNFELPSNIVPQVSL